MKILLWVVYGVAVVLYRWVGKVYVSQPKFNHPQVFWNPVAATVLVFAPLVAFVAVVACGFIFTSSGWTYLAAVVIAFIFLSSRPTQI